MSSRLLRLFAAPILFACGCGNSSTVKPLDPKDEQNKRVMSATKALKDPVSLTRQVSAGVLEREGAAAKSAIPDLEEVAKNDKDPKVKQAANKALEKLRAL